MIEYIVKNYRLDRRKVKKAVDFVYSFDKKDGFTQAEIGIVRAIQTSILAISAGLNLKDDSNIYEAIVMLQQVINKIEADFNTIKI